MLIRGPGSRSLLPLLTRSMGGHKVPATYESEIVTKEIKYRKAREYRKKLEAEQKYVNSLPGISSDEYKPSLEPGTINLRSLHPPYFSPLLRRQDPEVTRAAFEKQKLWQKKLSDAHDTQKFDLFGELLEEFKFVMVTDGHPIHNPLQVGVPLVASCLRWHGIVSGIDGYMMLDIAGQEDLAEACIQHSQITWMPQCFAGGHSIGSWRHVTDLHNSGELVQILEGCGLASKLKGCYYFEDTPLVQH